MNGPPEKVLCAKVLCAFSAPYLNFPVTHPQYFLKSTAVQVGGVLPYKWEAYCSTNERRIVGFPFLQGLEAREVQPYYWTTNYYRRFFLLFGINFPVR